MEYSTLDINQLFGRYFVNEDERQAINAYVPTLPHQDKDYFYYLISINDVSGESFEALHSLKKSQVFVMDDKRSILFDRDNYLSSKGYIDTLLNECLNHHERIEVIEDEKAKVLDRIAELKAKRGSYNSRSESRAVSEAQFELSEYLSYIGSLLNPKAEIERSSYPEDTPSASFDNYLLSEGTKILPFLKNQYKGGKPKMWAIMLVALSDLSLISSAVLCGAHSALHDAMMKTFGKNIGSRQNLSNTLQRLNSPSADERALIKKQKELIINALKASNLRKTCCK